MEATHNAQYDTDSHIVYMCKKNIIIKAINLRNKVDIDYWKLAQIGGDTISSSRFISDGYNSRKESVFH